MKKKIVSILLTLVFMAGLLAGTFTVGAAIDAPSAFWCEHDSINNNIIKLSITPPADISNIDQYTIEILDSAGNIVTTSGFPSSWNNTPMIEHYLAYVIHDLRTSGTYTLKLYSVNFGENYEIQEKTACPQTITLNLNIDPVPITINSVIYSGINQNGIPQYDFSGDFNSSSAYLTILYALSSGMQFPSYLNAFSYSDEHTLTGFGNETSITPYASAQSFTNSSISGSTVSISMTLPQNPLLSISGIESNGYLYDAPDPGESVTLPVDQLQTVTDQASAVAAVNAAAAGMTEEQKSSATGVDKVTLYADESVAQASEKTVSGGEIAVSQSAISGLAGTAKQTAAAVSAALAGSGITAERDISSTVLLTTDATDKVSVNISQDITQTDADKVRVDTSNFGLTVKVGDIAPDLSSGSPFTITLEEVGTGIASGTGTSAVRLSIPNGSTTNPVTLSLPPASGDTTFQTIVKADGTPVATKYNPTTKRMEAKVTQSGTYTVKTNEKDFTDIANKSAEMQRAIKYLASKGIIGGTTETTFSPDSSISRAEIAALILRALGKLNPSATNTFKDVTTSNWYYAVAGSSQKYGIINGYDDGTFRGGTVISKVQIMAVASRVLKNEMGYKVPSSPSTYLSQYSDSSGIASWAAGDVALTTRENLVLKRTDGMFSGDSNMTRGDAAIVIYRMFMKIW